MPTTITNTPVPMTGEQAKALPDADFVYVVKLPRDAQGKAVAGQTTVDVLVAAHLQIAPVLDLSQGRTLNATDLQMLPGKDQLLMTIGQDGTATVCTNRPQWRWAGMTMTE